MGKSNLVKHPDTQKHPEKPNQKELILKKMGGKKCENMVGRK